jgi:hypothetical protein
MTLSVVQVLAQQSVSGPVAPAWLVLPLAVLALLVVAWHWVGLARAEMPAARKRIRSVCGALMMVGVPVFAYAFGIASPARPRQFVLAWMLASSVLLLVLLMAAADLAYTGWEARREMKRLRREVLERE